MDICTKHGTDIAFDVRNCPACDEVEDLKGKITDLQDKIATLQEEE